MALLPCGNRTEAGLLLPYHNGVRRDGVAVADDLHVVLIADIVSLVMCFPHALMRARASLNAMGMSPCRSPFAASFAIVSTLAGVAGGLRHPLPYHTSLTNTIIMEQGCASGVRYGGLFAYCPRALGMEL